MNMGRDTFCVRNIRILPFRKWYDRNLLILIGSTNIPSLRFKSPGKTYMVATKSSNRSLRTCNWSGVITLNVVPVLATPISEPTGRETGTEATGTATGVTVWCDSEVRTPCSSDSFVSGSEMSGITTVSDVRSSSISVKWREVYITLLNTDAKLHVEQH